VKLENMSILHPEQFTELVLTKGIFGEDDANGYVQDISYILFMVIMYTEESIQVAKQCIKKGSGVFYLDAAGTIVRGIYDERELLYYAPIVQGENSSPFFQCWNTLQSIKGHTTLSDLYSWDCLEKN